MRRVGQPWLGGGGVNDGPTIVLECRPAPLEVPASTASSPGTYADGFWETLEGVLVQVPNPVTVSPANDFRAPIDSNMVGPNNQIIWVVTLGNYDAASPDSRGGLVISATDYNPERILPNDNRANLDTPSVDVGTQLSTSTGSTSLPPRRCWR